MIHQLVKFSLRQRTLVILATGALVFAGLWSAFRLPIDAVPDITNIQVRVDTEVPALAPEEIAAYDAVVTSGDPNSVYWAVQGLRSKYVEANGYEGKQVSGNRAVRPEPGFRSQAELARAISDPRYRDDPAYRMDVEQKLARSGDLM